MQQGQPGQLALQDPLASAEQVAYLAKAVQQGQLAPLARQVLPVLPVPQGLQGLQGLAVLAEPVDYQG